MLFIFCISVFLYILFLVFNSDTEI